MTLEQVAIRSRRTAIVRGRRLSRPRRLHRHLHPRRLLLLPWRGTSARLTTRRRMRLHVQERTPCRASQAARVSPQGLKPSERSPMVYRGSPMVYRVVATQPNPSGRYPLPSSTVACHSRNKIPRFGSPSRAKVRCTDANCSNAFGVLRIFQARGRGDFHLDTNNCPPLTGRYATLKHGRSKYGDPTSYCGLRT